MTHETEVKREDDVLVQRLIEGVFGKRGQSPVYQTAGRLIEELSEQFIVALATVRREEREAAFKEALGILNEFGRELRKADFLAKLEAVAVINKRAELDRVLVDAQIEDPVGVRLTELELERLDRLEASASDKGEMNG